MIRRIFLDLDDDNWASDPRNYLEENLGRRSKSPRFMQRTR
jgi:hypothetical protein